MKIVLLTQGKMALVDDEDYERVKQFKWRVARRHGLFYARRHTPMVKGKRTTQFLHQFLCPGVPRIDHKNGNGLDNRKDNLRPASRAQNRANSTKRKPATSQFKGVHWVRLKLLVLMMLQPENISENLQN